MTATKTMSHGALWSKFEKLGVPVNKLVNKVGSESFWPQSLDHESDKASRILQSFCSEGFYKEQPLNVRGPKSPPQVLVKIPPQVIQNSVGLAIFSVGRIGTWGASISGGSGVLIARKEDGTWSPPSGILVNTLGLGFMAGIDVYDCVLVINNREALKSFTSLRVSLGGEASLTVGPVGAGGILDAPLQRNGIQPIFTYTKSRGLYAGIQLDGTIIGARNDENARYYGQQASVSQVLSGNLHTVPGQANSLIEFVHAAEGYVEPANTAEYEVFAEPEDMYGEKKDAHDNNEKITEKTDLLVDEKEDVKVAAKNDDAEWETLPSPTALNRPQEKMSS